MEIKNPFETINAVDMMASIEDKSAFMENFINFNAVIPVNDGTADPIRAYKMLAAIKTAAENAMSEIKQATIDEIEKYTKTEQSEMGITVRDGVKRYSYKNIPEWVDANNAIKDLEAELKQRAAVNGEVIDPESGEILPKPEVTYTERAIVVSKPKNKK